MTRRQKSFATERLDGVLSIGGGGSVMCAGKGIAIAAANDCSIRECNGGG